jgi:DNA-binding Lrp family transcriptional regulator
MKDLADKIHRTKPTVTVLVDKLVELGYVTKEKSYEDSRVTYISLTEKGAALKPVFTEISDTLNALVYDYFIRTRGQVLCFVICYNRVCGKPGFCTFTIPNKNKVTVPCFMVTVLSDGERFLKGLFASVTIDSDVVITPELKDKIDLS